jgi:hypothetical protein
MWCQIGFCGWGGEEKNQGWAVGEESGGRATGCQVGVRDPVALVGKFMERGLGSGSFVRNKLK